ncbi:DUF6265 family protein [Chryseolinea lacunae]|uniref:DUF6265 domain-containing protein n=1 Tax=Chryseolinea lacunae TaxID=2801331 RepID=A0ABS1KT50_9BACT|nr:DUF6265 family protein [Chryseolinea lacunae]MBL0741877.1 hypothetical protein [Chryseolinea lacunae]
MLKRLLLPVVFIFPFCVFAQRQEFSWLVGTWQLTGKPVFEVWKESADHATLEGISFRVKQADTVVTEEIKLMKEGNDLYYTPDVAGPQGVVKFKITQHDVNGFVAENATHDFPKIIRYRRETGTPETLKASIEGDGKVINYTFVRVK